MTNKTIAEKTYSLAAFMKFGSWKLTLKGHTKETPIASNKLNIEMEDSFTTIFFIYQCL